MAPDAHHPAVSAHGVVLGYGDRVALAASDFEIPAGALTALIGPNGSGKSTILNAIAGLLRPTAGQLSVPAAMQSRPALAYVLQATRVNEAMPVTVREVVGMGRYGSLGPFRRFTAQDRALCMAAMERLGIAELAGRRLAELSGGQRQRVFVAQGLAQAADLLLLDEPITALDLPSTERIRAVVAEERGRVEMLEHFELDIAWMIPLRREPPVHYRAFFQPALHVFYLAFDCRSEKSPYVDAPTNPFRDPRVRLAFMYGIDTSALIDEVFSGHAYEASQLVSPSIFGYDPDLKRPAPDRGKARELLAAAGYPGGFSVRLDLQPTRRPVGELLRREYEKIGIRIELNIVPKEQFYDKIYTRRDSSLYFLGWACSSGDASELFEYALHTEDPVNLLGVRNVSGYSNIEVDRLIEKSLSTFDSKERLRMLQDAMGIVMTDMPLLPLYIGEDIYGVANTITFMPRLDDHILGYDAHPNE